MIIKDKPFLWICSYSGQPVLCWHHFSPAVLVLSSGSCRFERLRVVRFHRLQAYQARLSRFLVMRRADFLFDRGLDRFLQSPDWRLCDWSAEDGLIDGLIHARGAL